MKVIRTDIEGVFIIEPLVHGDERGYFFESFKLSEFEAQIGPVNFVQDNQSRSARGVVRGMHFQMPPHSQAKLVRVVEGEVMDVAVDLRRHSPTYGKWTSCILSAENHRQLFIPKGFAHGFAVLSDFATLQYKCDDYYHPESESGLLWNDPALAIPWPTSNSLLSPKDLSHPPFKDFITPFE